MPSSSHLVRIPFHKNDADQADFALVHVEPAGPESHDYKLSTRAGFFDLNLIATEQLSAFTLNIASTRGEKSNSNGTKAAGGDPTLWNAVLAWVFLRQRPVKKFQQVIDNLEVTSALNKDGMTISIKQSISGITQRLGSLHLQRNDDKDLVDLYKWAEEEAEASVAASRRLLDLEERCGIQQTSIDRLKAQLDEFVKLKQTQDDKMLEQFRQLLNTKKLKIRDQQRLLAGAKIDGKVAADVKGARSKANSAAARKRKGMPIPETGSDDEGAASASAEDANEQPDTATPERSDESESGGSAFGVAPAQSQAPGKGKALGNAPQRHNLPSGDKHAERDVVPTPDKEVTFDDDEETDDEL